MSLHLSPSALGARFDAQALHAPAAAPRESTLLQAHAATAEAVLGWCHAPERLAVAALLGVAGVTGSNELSGVDGDLARCRAWADALARHIDGGSRLDRMGRLAGLAWRLRVIWQDAEVWQPRPADAPWDAGWLINSPAALRHLAQVWTPRRPTLLLANADLASAGVDCLAALPGRQRAWRHKVRLLWVGDGAAALAPATATRFRLD